MPTDAHRELLGRRRREIERQIRIAAGEDRAQWALRRVRGRAGRVRQRVGLGYSWYEQAPVEVAAAFPDLAAV